MLMVAGGNAFGVQALKKVSDIIAAYPKKITASVELKNVQGVGKASIAKVMPFLERLYLSSLAAQVLAVCMMGSLGKSITMSAPFSYTHTHACMLQPPIRHKSCQA